MLPQSLLVHMCVCPVVLKGPCFLGVKRQHIIKMNKLKVGQIEDLLFC